MLTAQAQKLAYGAVRVQEPDLEEMVDEIETLEEANEKMGNQVQEIEAAAREAEARRVEDRRRERGWSW